MAQHADGALPGQSSLTYGEQVNTDLLDFISSCAGVVLDIGCGKGAWANELRRRGASRCVGVEPQPSAAAAARRFYDEVWQGTVEDCPLERWRGCDLIVCADVLEHLYDPWSTVRRFRDACHDGTRLVISVPNLRYLPMMLRLGLRGEFDYCADGGYFDVGHLRWFTRQSLDRMLAKAGWRVTQSGGRPGRRLGSFAQTQIGRRLWPDLLRYQIFVMAMPTLKGMARGLP